MLPIRLFSIEPTPAAPQHAHSRLLIEGHPTATLLQGCNLLAQFCTGQHYVLITDHDSPFEEHLCIHLLDLELDLLDVLELSRPLVTGCFELLFAAAGELAFRFFTQEEIWRLSLVRPARFPPLRAPRFPVKRVGKVQGNFCLQLSHGIIHHSSLPALAPLGS